MNIDLTKLITNNESVINLKVNVSFDEEQLKKANIRSLKNTVFNGKIRKLIDDDYEIEGNIVGVMVLADDITLEDVDYDFNISVLESFSDISDNLDNNLKIVNNKLDISEFLWQNIVLEIPSKIVIDKNKNISLEGNGWRLISEEELEKEKNSESPFSELDNKF